MIYKKNQKNHYSPLRYPGGKTFLFQLFDRVIMKSDLKNVTYVEPFAGGAGAALALLFLKKVKRIVINDFDKAIYSFWRSAIFESREFIAQIQSIPVSVAEWKKQKAIYNNPGSDQFKLGFATFFLNRTNVSGILDGGPIGGLEQKGKWKIDARFNKKTLIERIQQLSLYKNKISVFNRDGVRLIIDYLNKKNAFVYLDPPYYEKGATLYLNHYREDDHKALAKLLNKNSKANWLMTYDDKKAIKALYPDRKIIKFLLNYNAYESRKGKEMLIFSDSLVS